MLCEVVQWSSLLQSYANSLGLSTDWAHLHMHVYTTQKYSDIYPLLDCANRAVCNLQLSAYNYRQL